MGSSLGMSLGNSFEASPGPAGWFIMSLTNSPVLLAACSGTRTTLDSSEKQNPAPALFEWKKKGSPKSSVSAAETFDDFSEGGTVAVAVVEALQLGGVGWGCFGVFGRWRSLCLLRDFRFWNQ